MALPYAHDFTENLEAVARGVRLLDEVRDPELRDAIRAALGMPPERAVLDGARRARIRRSVLSAEPRGPRLSDGVVAVLTILAYPAPYAARALAMAALVIAALAGTAVASADAIPDDALYSVKLGAEELRLALAVAPADRAAVELSLAEHRLAEAEELAATGHESGALVATSAYAAHLATAAAELSEVDELAPHATALVLQLEARLGAQRLRAAGIAERLMSDPRTALAGVVLSAIATAPAGTGPTAAARIADSASAVSARLSAVADERASGGRPLHDALNEIQGRAPGSRPIGAADQDEEEPAGEESEEFAGEDTAPMFVVPPAREMSAPPAARTATPARTAQATPRAATTAGVTEGPTARPVKATPWPTVDPSARIAAEKAKQSAAKAKAALEKAKQAAKRTPSPKPTPTR